MVEQCLSIMTTAGQNFSKIEPYVGAKNPKHPQNGPFLNGC